MPTAYDVPQERLVEELAKVLKEQYAEVIRPPEWAWFCKTGRNRERVPHLLADEWWYIRAASVLKKVYMDGPVGIERLRTYYGGRKNNGMRKEHFYKGSGSIVRKILQQLEAAGLVTKYKNKGRIVTPSGKALVDKVAAQILKQLAQEDPEFTKYL
ncbi:MAG: 30S ribosomal protein S19e [bacterium]|nr:30S ribosomal protein S19e [bacterium]